MSKALFACSVSDGLTRADHARSTAWMIGGTAALAMVYLALERSVGENALVEALGISAFPLALTFAMRFTYWKPYSRPAAVVMIAGTAAFVFVVTLAAVLLANEL